MRARVPIDPYMDPPFHIRLCYSHFYCYLRTRGTLVGIYSLFCPQNICIIVGIFSCGTNRKWTRELKFNREYKHRNIPAVSIQHTCHILLHTHRHESHSGWFYKRNRKFNYLQFCNNGTCIDSSLLCFLEENTSSQIH